MAATRTTTASGSRASVPAARFAPPVPRSVVDAPNSAPVVISAGVLDRDRAEAARANSTASFCRARLAELSATRMSDTLLRSLDSSRTTRRFSSSRWRMYSTVGCALSSLSVASCTSPLPRPRRPLATKRLGHQASAAFDAEGTLRHHRHLLSRHPRFSRHHRHLLQSLRGTRARRRRDRRGSHRPGLSALIDGARATGAHSSATRYDPSSTFRMIWFIASAHR